jgi:hypothetical protein
MSICTCLWSGLGVEPGDRVLGCPIARVITSYVAPQQVRESLCNRSIALVFYKPGQSQRLGPIAVPGASWAVDFSTRPKKAASRGQKRRPEGRRLMHRSSGAKSLTTGSKAIALSCRSRAARWRTRSRGASGVGPDEIHVFDSCLGGPQRSVHRTDGPRRVRPESNAAHQCPIGTDRRSAGRDSGFALARAVRV